MIRAAVVLVLCLIFAAGHTAVSNGDHGGFIDEQNAMLDFHDSLAKFASSLRKFEKRGQEVLNAAAGKGNGSALAAEGDTAVLEPRRRRRSRRRRGRGGGDGGVAAYRSDDRSFKTQAYVTDGTDDLVQKRDDESLRVIRIKILHHGRGEGDAARGPYSKTTPCPVELLASAAVGRTTVVAGARKSTRRVRSTQKAKQKVKKTKANRSSTSKNTSSVSHSTSAPIKNCAQNDDIQVAQDNLEVQDSEHQHEESLGEDASEETASQSRDDETASQADRQPLNEDGPPIGSDGESGTESGGSLAAEGALSANVRTSQVTKRSGAKPYNLPSRGDHLRIHIDHKPSNPQVDVNETFFANHSLVNKTGQDVLMVKTDDHFFVTNGSKAVKLRQGDRDPFHRKVLNYYEARENHDREPNFANQEHVQEFENRVKQANESLQRIRNYRQPPKAKQRSRRNVRFVRSLRFAPLERSDTSSRKGEIQRSRVVGASSSSIRAALNRRLDNEEGAQKVSAGRVAPTRNTEPRAEAVLLLELRARAKRGTNKSTSADERSGDDVFVVLFNNTEGSSEPLLNLPGKVSTTVAYALDSRPVGSKYEQLRFRALALACVLAVVSAFTVAVVLTMLYFDLNRLFHFQRGFKYNTLDLTMSAHDN